jgi:hypothetical protein
MRKTLNSSVCAVRTRSLCSVILLVITAALQGCESAPEKSGTAGNEPAKPQLETGRVALQKMIVPARVWAADSKPIRMISNPAPADAVHSGGAGLWKATFASPARGKTEAFSWSGLVGPNAPPRGVDHGSEDTFNPSNLSTQPFDVAFLKIDSDQAFAVAQKHGGKELLEKNPSHPLIYILDWDSQNNELRWHVIYGSAPNKSQLTIIVDASTGSFVHKE